MIRKMFLWMFLRIGRARWIIDEDGDPGIRVFGVNIIYYKWNDTFVLATKSDYVLAKKNTIRYVPYDEKTPEMSVYEG